MFITFLPETRLGLYSILGLVFVVADVKSDEKQWPEIESWVVNEHGRLEYTELSEPGPPVFEKHWVERSREGVTSSWKSVTGVVDSYVSNDDSKIINDSYMRLRVGSTFLKDDQRFTADIKIDTDLPKTENRLALWADNRLKVFVDTDPEDQKSLEQQSLDRAAVGSDNQDRGATAGVRLSVDGYRQWKTDFDIGIKSSIPVDPFTRLRLSKEYQFGEKWKAIWRHRLFAYYRRDSGYQTDFRIYRPISERVVFQNTSEVRWNHDEKVLDYANITAFKQAISNHSYAEYSFGAFYEDHPYSHLTNYFVQFSYTRRLYEDWFFVQLVPRNDWPRQEDFKATHSFLVRFDIFFAN